MSASRPSRIMAARSLAGWGRAVALGSGGWRPFLNSTMERPRFLPTSGSAFAEDEEGDEGDDEDVGTAEVVEEGEVGWGHLFTTFPDPRAEAKQFLPFRGG